MKVFESRASYELSAILTNIEALLYGEAFRNRKPITIPELDNKRFVIEEMTPYQGGSAPENAWHLVIKQETAESTMPPAAFDVSDEQSLEENGDK